MIGFPPQSFMEALRRFLCLQHARRFDLIPANKGPSDIDHDVGLSNILDSEF